MCNVYDKSYGDYKKCKCGHAYVSHFSTVDPYIFDGCSLCICGKFVLEEAKEFKDNDVKSS